MPRPLLLLLLLLLFRHRRLARGSPGGRLPGDPWQQLERIISRSLTIAAADGMGIPLSLADPEITPASAVQDVMAALHDMLARPAARVEGQRRYLLGNSVTIRLKTHFTSLSFRRIGD